MNKLADLIHRKFVAGEINGVVFEYMQTLASSVSDSHTNVNTFNKHIVALTKLGAKTVNECDDYFSIWINAPKIVEGLLKYKLSDAQTNELCAYIFNNKGKLRLNNSNYCKFALDFINSNKHLIKAGHPNTMGMEGSIDIKKPYDLDKWVETMRYIYSVANTNNLPLDSITKKVIAGWSEEEKLDFQRWMKYYQEGNYKKYNVKTAQFFTTKPQEKAPDLKQVQDMFEGIPKADPAVEKKRRLDEARKKLRGRLKSVEELVEQYRDVLPRDLSGIIRKDVFDLKEKILGLELKASMVDSIIRTSNKLNKYGFIEGAVELKKIAQEVAENKLPEVKEEIPTPALEKQTKPVELMNTEPEKDPSNIPSVDATRSNIDMPDFSNISYREAIHKLEEINAVISERAVVRALAGVDIILNQLGISSYFNELTESQSKLLEAFQYSSTRISNVLSQLRGRRLEEVKKEEAIEKAQDQKKKQKKEQEEIETAEELSKPVNTVETKLPQV